MFKHQDLLAFQDKPFGKFPINSHYEYYYRLWMDFYTFRAKEPNFSGKPEDVRLYSLWKFSKETALKDSKDPMIIKSIYE